LEYIHYRNWWSQGLKGLLVLLIGIVALAFPGIALVSLATYFGIIAVVAGLFIGIAAVLNKRRSDTWYFWLVEGIVDIAIGAAMIAFPKVAVGIMFLFFGIWALVMGIFQLLAFIRLRKMKIGGSSLTLLNSIISILFGLALLVNPFGGGVAITSIFGIFAILYGIISIVNAFKFSKVKQ